MRLWTVALAVLGAAITVVGANALPPPARPASDDAQVAALRDFGFGPTAMARLKASMDPATLAYARRFDPAPHADHWYRAGAWSTLDIANPPKLPFPVLTVADAMQLNALLPAAGDPSDTAPPFFLRAAGPERERALLCLTDAIYYEAALEPTEGQEAVAQTVLNRLRHPAFPKSICGVVFQGSQQITGCQFSFTCDGSMQRPPVEPFWSRARAVAEQALNGYVQPAVGAATHYHADYVFPSWGPTMLKIGQIGAHIFYRYPGPFGRVENLSAHYGGHELEVSMMGPSPDALLAAQAAAQASQAPVQAIIAAAPGAPPILNAPPMPGQVIAGRRIPTREEIARINAQLASLGDGPIATAGADARPASATAPMIAPPPATPAASPAHATH